MILIGALDVCSRFCEQFYTDRKFKQNCVLFSNKALFYNHSTGIFSIIWKIAYVKKYDEFLIKMNVQFKK